MWLLNIIQISLLEERHDTLWIDGVPAIVFSIGVVVILTWAVLDLNSPHRRSTRPRSRQRWTPDWWARCLAIASVILTILLPFAIMQFWYMDTVALPSFNQTSWVTSIETRPDFSLPTFNISLTYQTERDPLINITIVQYGDPELNQTVILEAPTPICDKVFCHRYWTTYPPPSINSPFNFEHPAFWVADVRSKYLQYTTLVVLYLLTSWQSATRRSYRINFGSIQDFWICRLLYPIVSPVLRYATALDVRSITCHGMSRQVA